MKKEEEFNLNAMCKCGHKKRFHNSRRGYHNMECEHQSKSMEWDNFQGKEVERHFKDCSCKKFALCEDGEQK